MSVGGCGRSGAVLLFCLALGVTWLAATGAVEAAGGAKDNERVLPDWSGWWTLEIRIVDELAQSPPPLKPADLARYWEARRNDTNPDPGRFCRPPQFTGYSGGFTEAVEFLSRLAGSR